MSMREFYQDRRLGRAALLSSAAMLSTFALPSVAVAQQVDADASSEEARLEEIIVTARRREENLQTVPISITAISPEAIKDNNVAALTDIQGLVPSLTVTTGNVGQRETANVAIRGQGYGTIAGQPAVAMYLNEVPIIADYNGVLAGGTGLFFDLENVQILKGPQGTLFGRNTMGGAVLLQSARPKEEFGGRIQIGYGNYNNREIDAAVNLPISGDKVLARFAFNRQVRDGISRVLSTPSAPSGIDMDNRDFWAVRGTLTARPVDGVKNDTIVTYQSYRSNGSANFLTDIEVGGFADTLYPATPTSRGIRAALAQQQLLGTRTHIPIDTDLDSTSGSLLAVENITSVDVTDNITLRNIFGFRKATFNYRADLDGTEFALFNVVDNKYVAQQTSNELQLLGKSFGGRLDWVVGAFYSDQGPPIRDRFDRLAIRVVLPAGTPASTINADSNRRLTLGSKAVFAQGTYDLSGVVDNLKLTGGLRYTWDDRSDSTRGANNVITSLISKSSALTYTLGLDYQIAENTLMYLASRRGYRSGGSTRASNGTLFRFRPEFVTDYEFGLKSDWSLGGVKLRTNGAVYYQDYSKIQVNQLIPFPGEPAGINVTTNAGSARLWGAEFEAQIILTDNFQIGGNFSYLDFKYKKFAAGVDGPALQAGITANRVPVKYGLSARYDLPVSETVGNISLRANYAWQDKFGDFLGSATIPSYGLLNLAINWDNVAGKPVDAQFFMSNATNKTYQSGGIGFLGFAERTYGDPRMYGVRLSYRFGGDAR